ncbi:hypothetical protein FRC01_001837 [Tulasnella sp. 417]|nr:hypothetical protein FRC01_001837 [Tulasnella sp. 417]
MSFLSMGSLRNLMVNRSLRAICEDRLYKSISLDSHYWRTAHLFQTFRLRLDLARRVRQLEIDASEWDRWPNFPRVPSSIQFRRLNPLAFARNLRSLTLTNLRSWIRLKKRGGFQTAISFMELTHLGIEGMYDDPFDDMHLPEWDEDFFEDIFSIFQHQPLLKSFSLVRCPIHPTFVANISARLSPADVPALKSLTARPDVAAAFLSRIGGLESITLVIEQTPDFEQAPDFVRGPISTEPAENRASIHKLTFRVTQKEDWSWEQVSTFIPLFPDVEALRVVMCPRCFSYFDMPKGVESCLETMTSNIHILPLIRYLEITANTRDEIVNAATPVSRKGWILAYWDDPEIFKWLDKFVTDIKAVCPQLEMVIDPKRRVWDMSGSDNSGGGFSAKLLGKLELEQTRFVYDLPLISPKVKPTLRKLLGWLI